MSPAMRRQLQALAKPQAGGWVNLSTVRALVRRGFVEDNSASRYALETSCRLPGPYSLTDQGRRALEVPA